MAGAMTMGNIQQPFESIVYAALKKGNRVYYGFRHHTVIRYINEITNEPVNTKYEQGFLTNKNRFVNREEALQIALTAGQAVYDFSKTNKLFSEELWPTEPTKFVEYFDLPEAANTWDKVKPKDTPAQVGVLTIKPHQAITVAEVALLKELKSLIGAVPDGFENYGGFLRGVLAERQDTLDIINRKLKQRGVEL